MKIRKSTTVWSILAVLLFVSAFYEDEDESKSPTWKDATYVKDAKVLPENEGKLVAVSGQPVPLENVFDEITGVEFPSPKVYQYVDRVHYEDVSEKWEWKAVHPGSSSDGIEEGHLTGRIGLGEFELDEDLMQRLIVSSRDVEKSDFSEEAIAKMEERGYLVKAGALYYSIIPRFDNLTGFDYLLHPEWDNAYRVRFKMWVPEEEDRVTVVGIQKGNTLTYCEELQGDLSSKDEYMDENDFQNKIQTEEETGEGPKYVSVVLAVLCLAMAIRSLFKREQM